MQKSDDSLAQKRKEHAKDRALRKEKRRNVLLNTKFQKEREKNQDLTIKLDDLKSENDTNSTNDSEFITPLQDLLIHSNSKCKEPYSEEIIEMSLEIQSRSPSSYSLLCSKLPFPPKSQIESIAHEVNYEIPQLLKNTAFVNDIVNIWKEKIGIQKKQTIYACLSVDAIFFTPDIHLTDKSIFNGIIFTEEEKKLLPKNLFSRFIKNPNEFKQFLSLNSDKIIRTGFVFQIQPYNPAYSNFIVHILPACNGKANDTIIQILKEIKEKVKNRDITILSYAFDGDNAYSKLHEDYLNSYINTVTKNNIISFSKTLKFKVVSDFLHLIKRLRYRLFGNNIYCGFKKSDHFFNIDQLKKILPSLPNIVWCDESFCKMHDSLPLILFSPENLLILLLKNHYGIAAYFLPISLSILAQNYKELGYSNRMFLLQTSFWFLVYYREEKNKCNKIELGETKRNGQDIQFYSNRLLTEFLNTLHCHIQLMAKLETFSFNRNSSNPLEHKFGNVRRRSKYIHTLNKFCQVVSMMQVVEQKRALQKGELIENELEKIHCRQSSFGVTVESKNNKDHEFVSYSASKEEIINDKPYSPQAIAKAMLYFAGFNTAYFDFVSPDDALENLIEFLFEFIDETPIKKKKKISHRIITCGVGQCTNGQLLTTSSSRTYQIKTSKKELKKKILDDAIKKKLKIEKERKITKEEYYGIIKRIKNFSQVKMKIPKLNNKKSELIDWLLDHLGIIISIIPEI